MNTDYPQPGPELDRLVAEAIGIDSDFHNWRPENASAYNSERHNWDCLRCNMEIDTDMPSKSEQAEIDDGKCVPAYSTDWNDAMLAAEKAGLFDIPHGIAISRWKDRDPGVDAWYCVGDLQSSGTTTTGPHAISIAILRLKGK
ncbi:hypothetical protein [Planctomicrobium piriforme]|uniref:Uncharacterized protein n=1 Tax=Planctomicrobium piriforme TaxID=1576369 RepID=A0A1I3EDU6_9PLAN|nr:hypothetical protein [Planctomicrobium piriforme]SFH97140.1 hypothetical protein SAMN05421753_104180 [Planctomicrobium piriforme]